MRRLWHRISVWLRRLKYCFKCGEVGMHGDMVCPYFFEKRWSGAAKRWEREWDEERS